MSLFTKLTTTSKNTYIAILGLGISISGATAYAADLSEFSATYAIKAHGKNGTATRTLTKSGNGYHYSVKGLAAGIATLSQSAKFNLSGNKIAPSSSSMSVKFLGLGNTHNITFNNSTKTVNSTYKGKTSTFKMGEQAYDDLSLEAQIRHELINGRFTGSYSLVKKSGIETTKFKKSGTSKITVPAGTYEVVRIDRVHDGRGRTTSFWLAPSLSYLPVKVSQTSDGKSISMELTKFN
ncbi:DUF3108 domain-containing protein [Moraxella haemolytica]|nr:DUF3108 domain-containing protein [Moraxella sp. ZY171148]WII95598.1 DUF3108 domain-containing protein [Moraxella sp. ZY171148]